MIDTLHVSETGLKANQLWLDHLSNNIANMHTIGYKKSTVSFVDLVQNNSLPNKAISVGSSQHGLGTTLSEPKIEFNGGALKSTGEDLDIAIRGKGLLEVVLANGDTAYTRRGSLIVNPEGYLATSDGYVLSEKIEIPFDVVGIKINPDGAVEGSFSGGEPSQLLGNIELAIPSSTSLLTPIGGGLYRLDGEYNDLTLNRPGEQGAGEILQGFLETSNVELVDEMTNLVLAQRAYQLNARMIQTADQLLETINNLRR